MSQSSDARVALVAIGDELLAGKHPDLNSPWMAKQLLDLDLAVDRIVIANDDLEELSGVFRSLCERYDFVFSSGGLGPTLDDVTRHAAASAAGVNLVRNELVLDELREWFEGRGIEMVVANERQALFPERAHVIENRVGTAPGFRVQTAEAWLTCLPGPPREMKVLFAEEVLPWLAELVRKDAEASRVAKHSFHLFGLSESLFAEQVGSWMDRPQNPLMSVTVSAGVLTSVLRARASTLAEAEAILAPRVAEFRERFELHTFSEESSDLAAVLGQELLLSKKSLTVAESCTGGGVAARLTAQAGISAVFSHGFVTYANRAKRELLGVPEALLEAHGAVSSEVAAAMAAGALKKAGSDLAVAITGIAGPGGGSAEKPVGTVWFGLAKGEETRTVLRQFPDLGREWVRTLATQTALNLARTIIHGDGLPDLD